MQEENKPIKESIEDWEQLIGFELDQLNGEVVEDVSNE